MSSVTESNLGLNYGWAYGESGWNTGMDDNLVKLGFTSRNQVKGILSAPPSTPSNGDAYIVGTTPTGLFSGKFANIAIYDRSSWIFIVPKNQEVVFNTSDGCDYIYNNGWSLKLEAEVSPYIKIKDFTFSTGYTITDQKQCLLNITDNHYYQWNGTLPKVVAAGATPATSGGIGVDAWSDKTDLMLRSDINIVQKRFLCVSDMVADTSLTAGKIVETIGYYNGWAATADKPKGGNRYEVVAAGTGTADGGSFITLSNGLQAKGLFIDKITNPYQFGAKSDEVSDDWQSLQNQANYCYNSGYLMDLLSGNYRLSATLDFVANQPVNSNFEMPYGITSDGRTCVFTYTGTGGTALSLVSASYQKNISNGIIRGGFKIVNAGTGEIGFHFLGINNWEIENLHVSGFSGKQVLLESNSGKAGLWNRFENTYVYGGQYGLYVGETANANTFDRIFAGGCAIDQIYTQGDRTQIYSLSIDDGGTVCRSGIFCAGTTTIFGVEIEMGGTTGNTNFLGAIYGGGSVNDYLTVYNFTAVGVTPRYAWNDDMNVVIYPSRSSTSTGNGLEIIASGDIKAPNIRLQPRMRVITNTLVSGVSSTYSTYQSLWNGGYGDFTIDTKTVSIVNNTNVILDFQLRYRDTSDTDSSVSLVKSSVAAGATLTLTHEEIASLMKGFSGDVILKGLVVRVRTSSASYTGTINSSVTGLQF